MAGEGSWLGKDPGRGEVMVGELDPGWGPAIVAEGGAKGSSPAEGATRPLPCSRFLPSPPPVPNYSGQALSLVTSPRGTPTLVPQVHGATHQPTQEDPSSSACTWGGGARERRLRFVTAPAFQSEEGSFWVDPITHHWERGSRPPQGRRQMQDQAVMRCLIPSVLAAWAGPLHGDPLAKGIPLRQ